MLRISALLLLLMLLSQACLLKLAVIMHYECNRAYISQHLCENRGRPAMKCCGKCYLRKQLARADKSAAKNEDRRTVKDEMSPFLIPATPSITRIVAIAETPVGGYLMPFAAIVAPESNHPLG